MTEWRIETTEFQVFHLVGFGDEEAERYAMSLAQTLAAEGRSATVIASYSAGARVFWEFATSAP